MIKLLANDHLALNSVVMSLVVYFDMTLHIEGLSGLANEFFAPTSLVVGSNLEVLMVC